MVLHSTALNQLLKLPVLVAHYIEHQHRDSHISVLDFLSMHYWGKDINDNDDDRDRQLPFKTVDMHSLHCSFVPLLKPIALKQREDHCTVINYPAIKDQYLPDPARASLFRPPRA
ncbi:hypothetical protein [Deminuibacter soli]|uniref:Uncharacterized protein n=1 Tax=Deminuibacter soli TaxID=2291815 RepID=A0A3E1NKU2_9BACT|nr:hypothetical protein [Deminuibacter soli]RFM28511.1 hypothetical protein DXN05_06805 [Deminuibacter soli]